MKLFGDWSKKYHSGQTIQKKQSSSLLTIALTLNTNSVFTESYGGNLIWCQQFVLRQCKRLKDGQPFVDFDAGDKFCQFVTTIEAMDFQDNIPSIPIDKFKYHFVFVGFDLNAGWYWKVFLTRTNGRTTETGNNVSFSSRTSY